MSKLVAFFAFFAVLVNFPAFAQTKITQGGAHNYFQSCIVQKDERLSDESKEMLCTCTATKMMEKMYVEDIVEMSKDTPNGRKMLNKMLIEVYAPCMEYPVHDLVAAQCLSDPKVTPLGPTTINKPKLCSCMAKKTGEWFAVEGKELMAELLLLDPNMTDPISPVMDSKTFKDKAFANLQACLKGKK